MEYWFRFSSIVLASVLVNLSHSAGLTTLPALAGFSDPAILRDDSSANWYAFSTTEPGKNVLVAQSSDFIQWSLVLNDALPPSSLPTWAKQDGPIWAPDVVFNTSHYIMYYTATLKDYPTHHCIGAAVSPNATGPYSPVGEQPLLCPSPTGHSDLSPTIASSGVGGAIDAFGFQDRSGQRYILYKVDGNSQNSNTGGDGICGNNGTDPFPTPIMIIAVKNDGVTPSGMDGPVQILDRDDEIDPQIIEAPSLTRLANGTYVLFYSSGCYLAPEYTVKFAVADNINSTYTKQGSFLATGDYGLDTPGGLSVAGDGEHLVFHANFQGVRSLYTRLLNGW